MSEKQFVCIDVGYGDDWYITDNGKRLSEIEIVVNDCEKFRYTVFKRIGDVLDE